jgi:hypothetical protein
MPRTEAGRTRDVRSQYGDAWPGVGAPLDLLVVLVFVVIGRSAHGHGLRVGGVVSTAWPFVSGLVVGWVALAAWRRTLTSWVGGLIVCIATVAIGMTLRVIAGQGTAFAFVLVALAFLGSLMIGWRVALTAGRRARSTRH